MATYAPLGPLPFQFQDTVTSANMSGGTLEFYLSGTATPTNLFSDNAGTSIGTSITLDSGGMPSSGGNVITLWRDVSIALKLVLKNAAGATISTSDTISTPAPFYDVTAAETAAAVTLTNYQYTGDRVIYVDRYATNTTPGTTDMTTAVRNAVAVAAQAGGGTIRFLPTTYLLTTVSTHSVVVPIAGANYTDDTQSYSYNVLLDGLDNITFDLNGATIHSDDTVGGTIFLLESCRNIAFKNGKITSVHSHNTTTGADIVVGMHPIAATSQDRNSYNISLKNLDIDSALSGIYCFGTISSTFRIRGVYAENVHLNHCRHGFPLHENGDHFHGVGLHCSGVLRDFFIYGANNGFIDMTADTGVNGFAAIIKAYRNDTKNWKVRYLTTKTLTSTAQVNIQSDYDTDTQATPKQVLNVELDIDNSGGSSSTNSAVAFSVIEDGSFVSGSNATFNGIVLRGIHADDLDFSNSPTQDVPGSLDTSGVIFQAGDRDAAYLNTGFYDPQTVAYRGSEIVTGTVTASLLFPETILNSNGGAVTCTCPDGTYEGQRKVFTMNDASNSSTVSVTSHDTSDPEVFTFDNTADYLVLEWSRARAAWWTVQNNGVAT